MSTFIYIQTVDCGLAPCVRDGIWSLALCKPAIRRCAEIGDVVISVTPCEDGHRLSSWARIKARIPTDEFFGNYPKDRSDNIYEPLRSGGFKRHSAVQHSLHNGTNDLLHDLGSSFANAWVLISKDFYTFGVEALPIAVWTKKLLNLREVVDGLARANRRYFDQDVEDDLEKLETFLETEHRRRKCLDFTPCCRVVKVHHLRAE